MLARRSFRYGMVSVLSLLSAAALIAGCSKKPEAAPAAQATSATDTNQTPAADAQPADAAAQAQAQAQPQAPTGPVLDTSQMSGDAKAAMAAADAAMRQREYEKAVRTMLAIQQAQLDAQQAAAAHQQMINLQKSLAQAAASGDPNAQVAAQLLRHSH